MKLVASMIVRDELGRYLEPCIQHLLAFCDEIRILDDGSTDGTIEYLLGLTEAGEPVKVWPRQPADGPSFFEHEGQARQALLDWTIEGEPTHILAIDADEFVADGQAVRDALIQEERRTRPHQRNPKAWMLEMNEIWRVNEARVFSRRDGLWRPSRPPILYRPPKRLNHHWRIRDKALACGREPAIVARCIERRSQALSLILHFGWANESEREARYRRYVVHDGGQFHQDRHLQSIMWPESRIQLQPLQWPAGLSAVKAILLDRATADRHAEVDRPLGQDAEEAAG